MKLTLKHIFSLIQGSTKSLFALLILALGSTSLIAQTQLERSVVSSGGNESSSNSIQLSSTVGEPAVRTAATTNFIFTQGFQQSINGSSADSLKIYLSSTGASCRGQSNGMAMIDSITGCQAPYQVIWSVGTNPSDSMQAIGLSPGAYTVQVISSDGCNDIFPFSIGLINPDDCLLKFYTGITPNKDGINDSWIIDNIDLFQINTVNIYNRLGNKVWEGKNYNNSNVVWSGENLNKKELPSATYFFIFEAEGITEKGWIELTR